MSFFGGGGGMKQLENQLFQVRAATFLKAYFSLCEMAGGTVDCASLHADDALTLLQAALLPRWLTFLRCGFTYA